METAAEISVGIPAYNQGRFISQTIESLLDQEVAPAEIVVCDNHSEDETAQVLEGFGDRIRVVRPPRHLPMYSHNWNHLVEHTNTPWVAILSSDDVALSRYVGTLRTGIERADDAVLVAAGWERIDVDGRVISSRPTVSPHRISRPPRNFLENLQWPTPRFGATAIRRDVWSAVGGFPQNLAVAADWGMWLVMSPHGAFVYEPGVVFQYRQDYRTPDENRARIRRIIPDYCTFFESEIPRIADCLGLRDHPEIAKVDRDSCYLWLYEASRHLEHEDRASIAEVLAPAARRCGLEDALTSYSSGRTLPRKRYGRIRLFASDVAEFLKGARPWRRTTRAVRS